MNILEGLIESVHSYGQLSLVYVKSGPVKLTAIVIDTPETAFYLKPGNPVKAMFKETEVIIGKGTEHAVSLQNRLAGNVSFLEKGELMSKLKIDTKAGQITSIITTNAVNQLNIEIGTELTAMVKTNEIMLSE